MHSGADVEALLASLTREIEEGHSSIPPLSDSDDVLSRGSNQSGSQDGKSVNFHIQQSLQSASQSQPEKNLPDMEQLPSGSILESPQQQPHVPEELNHLSIQQKQSQASEQIADQGFKTTGMQTSQRNANAIPAKESQCSKLQKMGNQQTSGRKQIVPFAALMPSLLPQLDKDRGMQLSALYAKFKRKEITREEFVRYMKVMVGNQMLRLTAEKLVSQMESNETLLPYESSTQKKSPRMRSFPVGAPQLVGPCSFDQHEKLGPNSPANLSHATSSVVSMTDPKNPSIRNDAQNSREMDCQSGSHIAAKAMNQERNCSSISGQGLTQQQKPHLASYSAADVNASGSSSKSQPHDSQMRQLTHHSSTESTTVPGSTQGINMTSGPICGRQNSISDPTKLQGGSVNRVSSNPVPCQVSTVKELKSSPLSTVACIKQKSVGHAAGVQHDVLLSSQNPSVTSPAGVNARTPQKKPSVGKKRPLQALNSSPTLPSKRQKLSGAFSDQSIKQLNDVTALSGLNLQEEEERLFSGPKEESPVSEASKRILHVEERGILLKTPLQKKLAEIMAKLGLKNISNDVERCLSLSVMERMRGLIHNLIRLSKQRANAEKPIYQKLITSDVRQQIITLNCNAKEELKKRQVEVEQVQKLDEREGSVVDVEKDKNEGQEKSLKLKINKDADDKMRATAANVAARAAFGGDDMLSKWQLTAEHARQKREREIDAVSSFQAGDNVRSTEENQGTEKRGPLNPGACGSVRKFGLNQVDMARTISVKDLIAVLEREPQMGRSKLIYRLYERNHYMFFKL